MLGNAINIATLVKFDYAHISSEEVFFLLYLFGKAHTTGNPFFYTDKKIQYETGLGYKQIKRRREMLLNREYIRIKHGIKNKTYYWIAFKKIAEDIDVIIKEQYRSKFHKQLVELHNELKTKKKQYDTYNKKSRSAKTENLQNGESPKRHF